MAQRPGVLVSRRQNTEAGVSPNQFVGVLQAEIRCHWTPYTSWQDVEQIIQAVTRDALVQAHRKYTEEGHPWRVGVGSVPGPG